MNGEQRQLKITNPQRIIRIFRKICQSRLYVFLRAEQSSNVVVKGRAEDLQNFKGDHGQQELSFYVTEISEKGVKYLFDKDEMQIEFVMTSTKVICVGRILRIRKGQVILSLPHVLTSVERRGNARYKTTEGAAGFLSLSIWQPRPDDYLSSPYFLHHKRFSTYLPLVDVGLGGVCFKSMFPSPAQIVEKDMLDPKVVIHLPMTRPFEIPLQFRWVKLIREHLNEDKSGAVAQVYHLFGCQFLDISVDSINHFKRFIQQVIESEAI